MTADELTRLQLVAGASAPAAAERSEAAAICARAAAIVKQRGTEHGDKLTNFQNIADLWNAWWSIKCRVHDGSYRPDPFTARDVCELMELMKIARRHTGNHNEDDYIDAAGYAGCAGEVAAYEQSRDSREVETVGRDILPSEG